MRQQGETATIAEVAFGIMQGSKIFIVSLRQTAHPAGVEVPRLCHGANFLSIQSTAARIIREVNILNEEIPKTYNKRTPSTLN